MATYFSLNDGIITDPNVFGVTVSSFDTRNLSSAVALSSIEYRLPPLSSNGISIAGIVLNLSAINLSNDDTTLTVKALCGEDVLTTKSIFLSDFTQFIDSNSEASRLSINYQLIQFDTPITISNNSFYQFTIQPSRSNQISLIGENRILKNWINNIDYTSTRTLTSDNPFNSQNILSYDLGDGVQRISLPNYGTQNGVFTIDFWYKRLRTGAGDLLLYSISSFKIGIRQTNGTVFLDTLTGISTIPTKFTTNTNILFNRWYHIALTKNSNQVTLYLDGLSSVVINNAASNNVFSSHILGENSAGLFNNVRMVSGVNLYSGPSFTVPNKLSEILPNTLVYVNSHTQDFNKSYINTFSQSVSTDRTSILNIFHNISTNNATNLSSDSIFIQNKGSLSFETATAAPVNNINRILLTGLSGLQIASNGTFNMGTINDPIKNITFNENITRCTANLILSGGQINVHNGGTFNAYGTHSPKSGLVIGGTINTPSTNTNITVVDNVSGRWAVNDRFYYTTPIKSTLVNPSSGGITQSPLSTNSITLTSVVGSHSFINGSNIMPHVPTIWNFTKNGKIGGFSPSSRLYVILNGLANFNSNNIEFFNLGSSRTNPFKLNTNMNSNINISGCSFNYRDNNTNLFDINTNYIKNFNFIDNNLYGNFNLTLRLSNFLENINITNNSILYSQVDGMVLSGLSGINVDIRNNFIISPKANGIIFSNINLQNSNLGGLSYNSNNTGMILSGVSAIKCNTINGGSIYTNNTNDGILYNCVNRLNDFNFVNLTSFSANGLGFRLDNSIQTHTNPLKLNIYGLDSRGNPSGGIILNNTYGDLTNINLLNNGNINAILRLGTGSTTINGLTSITPLTGIVLSGSTNYSETSINNALLSSSVPLILSANTLEQFSISNATLCGTNTSVLFLTSAQVPIIEGSYLFDNCYFRAGTEISQNHAINYQYDVNKETGLVVSKLSGNNLNNYKILFAGRISTDPSIKLTSKLFSERLTPISNNIKIRSTTKSIPINVNDLVVVGVSVYKSSISNGQNYTGSDPRIILKGNPSMGYDNTVLSTVTGANGTWINSKFTLPVSKSNGFAEIYVDCSGLYGSGFINVDGWYTNYGAGKYWFTNNPSLTSWSILDNWYLDKNKKFKAAALPSNVVDVVVIDGSSDVLINLDVPEWIEPKSIKTNSTISISSNNAKQIKSSIVAQTVRIYGNAIYNG